MSLYRDQNKSNGRPMRSRSLARLSSDASTRNGLPNSHKSKPGPVNANQLESQYIRNLQQQVYLLEMENVFLKEKTRKNGSAKGDTNFVVDSRLLIDNLRKSKRQREQVQSQFKVQNEEMNWSQKQIHHLQRKLKEAEAQHEREKQSLREDIVHLRKCLDDCKPEMAVREASAAGAQAQHQQTLSKLRQTELSKEKLQNELDNVRRQQESEFEEVERRKGEMDDIIASLQELEEEKAEFRDRIEQHNRELESLRKSNLEVQQLLKQEQSLTEQLRQQNSALVSENAQFQSQIASLHSQISDQGSGIGRHQERALSELAACQADVAESRQCRSRLEAQLMQQTNNTKTLTQQLAESESSLAQVEESLERLKKQIDILETQNRSLSQENQQLRSHNLDQQTKLEQVQRLVFEHESSLQTAREKIDSMHQHYTTVINRYEHKASVRDDKLRQFEKLVGKVRNISKDLRDTNGRITADSAISPDSYVSEATQ